MKTLNEELQNLRAAFDYNSEVMLKLMSKKSVCVDDEIVTVMLPIEYAEYLFGSETVIFKVMQTYGQYGTPCACYGVYIPKRIG